MRPGLYTIDLPGPGRLSTMAKPRGGDWLADEMAVLKSAGVDTLVCALTPGELAETGLTDEEERAHAVGLRFVSIPILDRSAPDPGSVLPVLRRLAQDFRDGAHIVTHCRFGIGRASLLAAGILVLSGLTPDSAWQHIQNARGVSVPDTDGQRQWPAALLKRDGLDS